MDKEWAIKKLTDFIEDSGQNKQKSEALWIGVQEILFRLPSRVFSKAEISPDRKLAAIRGKAYLEIKDEADEKLND